MSFVCCIRDLAALLRGFVDSLRNIVCMLGKLAGLPGDRVSAFAELADT